MTDELAKFESWAYLMRYSPKTDKSWTVTFQLPELTDEQVLALKNIHQLVVDLSFSPREFEATKTIRIDKEAGQKTPSERMRNAMYRYWAAARIKEDFDSYYKRAMEKKISDIKQAAMEIEGSI